VRIELKYRKELYGCDSEVLKVRNLLNQAGVSSTKAVSDAGVGMLRKASDMHFIDDRPRGRPL
jgi:hypothetical protein